MLESTFEESKHFMLTMASDLYAELPALAAQLVAGSEYVVSLELAAKRLMEAHDYDQVSQEVVWKTLQSLHDMGRIKLSPVLNIAQTGKSLRSVVLSARFTFCKPPFRKPAKGKRYGWRAGDVDISASPATPRELKVLSEALQVMRGDPKKARQLVRMLRALPATELENQ